MHALFIIAQQTDMMAWAQNFGLPVAIVLGIISGTWRFAKWFGPRLEGWVTRLLEAHEKLVNNTISIQRENADTLKAFERRFEEFVKTWKTQ